MAGSRSRQNRNVQLATDVAVPILVGLIIYVVSEVAVDVCREWKIASAVLLAVAIGLTLVWSAVGSEQPWWKSRGRLLLVGGLGVAAIACVVVGAFLADCDEGIPRDCTRPALQSTPIDGTAQIDNITKHQLFESPELVVGAFEDLDPAADLWVLVYATRADRFFPQSHREYGPADLRRGRFESRVNFAGREDETYEILAVLANKDASRFFSKTLMSWERQRDFPGLTRAELPGGLDEKDCVPVTLATAPSTTTPPRPLSVEIENAAGNGENRPRSAASKGLTRWLRSGESASASFDVTAPASYSLVVHYSNDNFGDLETISVAVDGVTSGTFQAQDTGDGGTGWNVFVQSPPLGPVDLTAGTHKLVTSASGGDGNGVEIDLVSIEPLPSST